MPDHPPDPYADIPIVLWSDSLRETHHVITFGPHFGKAVPINHPKVYLYYGGDCVLKPDVVRYVEAWPNAQVIQIGGDVVADDHLLHRSASSQAVRQAPPEVDEEDEEEEEEERETYYRHYFTFTISFSVSSPSDDPGDVSRYDLYDAFIEAARNDYGTQDVADGAECHSTEVDPDY